MSRAEEHFKEWKKKKKTGFAISNPTWVGYVYTEIEMIDFAEYLHQSRVNAKDKLIKILEDYIKFLGKHLSNHEAFMSNRGGYTSDKKAIQEGKEYRKRIKLLKQK